MSGAPFEGPVSGVKIALMDDGTYIYDPSFEQEEKAQLQLVVAGTTDAITMVEAGANQISDQQMLDALAYAHTLVVDLCNAQIEYIKEYESMYGKAAVKATYNLPDESLYAEVQSFLTEEKMDLLYNL